MTGLAPAAAGSVIVAAARLVTGVGDRVEDDFAGLVGGHDGVTGLALAPAGSVIAAAARLLTGLGDRVEGDTPLPALSVQPPGATSPVS